VYKISPGEAERSREKLAMRKYVIKEKEKGKI
jgi:hypothetical protein